MGSLEEEGRRFAGSLNDEWHVDHYGSVEWDGTGIITFSLFW